MFWADEIGASTLVRQMVRETKPRLYCRSAGIQVMHFAHVFFVLKGVGFNKVSRSQRQVSACRMVLAAWRRSAVGRVSVFIKCAH